MANFDAAVALVLKHEGGYVWNLNDPGGPTNYGITQAVYSRYLRRIASPDDVKNMPLADAKTIYKNEYWPAVHGAELGSQEVAQWVFDMSVLRGVGNGAKAMQLALGLTPDGIAGSQTIAALNKAQPAVFLNAFRSQCIKAFAAIVTARPASVEFLNNWVKRAEEMTDTVNALTQKTVALAAATVAQPGGAKT